jgi:valyl-tRNA synthetase
VDMEKEKKRIQKEIDKVTPYVESLEKKLKNKKFTSSAPKAVVEVEQKKLEEAISKLEKLRSQLGFFS